MNLTAVLPEIVLFLGALVVLMLDVFIAKKLKNLAYLSHLFCLVSCSIAGALAMQNLTNEGLFFHEMLRANSFIAFAKLFVIITLIFGVMLSIRFVVLMQKFGAEFLSLMMIATVGGLVMISANDFLVFYLGLELQALSSYLLASFSARMRLIEVFAPNHSSVENPQSLLFNCSTWQSPQSSLVEPELRIKDSSPNSGKSSEAGMKYFILGSLASGLLLFGISLVYGYGSTTNFSELAKIFSSFDSKEVPVAMVFGLVLILVAMLFKASAAPFHMWTPDVYQGSPTATSAFFATTGKLTAIFAVISLLAAIGWKGFSQILSLVALLSIAVGSFGAIFQKNLKRLLAYSSVSHVGFMLLAISVFGKKSITACILYLLIYVAISVGTFGFLTMIRSSSKKDSDFEDDKIFAIDSLSGLAKSNPMMAFSLSVLMFSTAGIPPLAGFFSKFYVLTSAVGGGMINFAIIAIIFSVISAFYYLRIVKIMYFDKPLGRIGIEDFGNVRIIVIASAIFNLLAIFFLKNLVFAIENFIIF